MKVADKTNESGAIQKFTLFYDSMCPVCSREVNFLRRFKNSSEVKFIDITDSSFNPEDYNTDMDFFVRSLRGWDGERFYEGMDTMRKLYSALGMGYLFSWTKFPLIKPLTDVMYSSFARVRPKLSRFKCESQ